MEASRARLGPILFLVTVAWLAAATAPGASTVTPTPVTAATTHVATIPRPPVVPEPPATNCPHDDPTLAAFQSAWLSPTGVLSIPAGQRVLLRPATDIPAGTLITDLVVPATSELVVDDEAATLRVRDVDVSGTMRLGSATCRLGEVIRFEFDTDEDVSSTGVQLDIVTREGLGIVVARDGVLEIYGRLYRPTWTRLASSAPAGASQIVLAESVDWEVGQQVVVVTTDRRDYP